MSLICGSQYAFGVCRFAGGTYPKCAATTFAHYACEYHDKGWVRLQLARMQYDEHIKDYHFRKRIGLMVVQPWLRMVPTGN